jgi:hypothetical protein
MVIHTADIYRRFGRLTVGCSCVQEVRLDPLSVAVAIARWKARHHRQCRVSTERPRRGPQLQV